MILPAIPQGVLRAGHDWISVGLRRQTPQFPGLRSNILGGEHEFAALVPANALQRFRAGAGMLTAVQNTALVPPVSSEGPPSTHGRR